MLLLVIGILSGLLGVAADIPYITDTLRRITQPHRVTWFIFFVLNAISLANNAASGATNSLLLIAGWTISSFVIFLLSISRGVGGHSKLDIVVLVGAAVGLLLWWRLGTPLASIIANIVVASIAFIPTYKKAYLDPDSETKVTWLIGSIGAIFGALSVGRLDYILLAFPLYALVAQGGLFILLEVRTRSLRHH